MVGQLLRGRPHGNGARSFELQVCWRPSPNSAVPWYVRAAGRRAAGLRLLRFLPPLSDVLYRTGPMPKLSLNPIRFPRLPGSRDCPASP